MNLDSEAWSSPWMFALVATAVLVVGARVLGFAMRLMVAVAVAVAIAAAYVIYLVQSGTVSI